MSDVSEARVLEALKTVKDPGSGHDVVSLGMIAGLTINGDTIGIVIEAKPGETEAGETLRRACERAVGALPGVIRVSAVLTAERKPLAHGRPGPRAGASVDIAGVKAIVAVASAKGGVGKSTTAVNLALALGQLGRRIGLLDADVYGPSIPRMLGLSGRPSVTADKRLEPMPAFGLKAMSIGCLLPETDTPMIWRGPMVMSAIDQMLHRVAWGELDALLVDMPPGTGDAQLTLAQRARLTGAVIVTTPQDIALLDARKGLQMFRRVDVPVFGIVENMSYFACPQCGHETAIFDRGGGRRTAAELGCDFLGEIPLAVAIRETSDGGRPVVASAPDSDLAKIYRTIAEKIAAKIDRAAETTEGPRIVIQ
jgi:ATP-binding protein involved in chromosome partitioning